MSVYHSSELLRLLVDERLRDAERARFARESEQNSSKTPGRSILGRFRRRVPADCVC
jgi:hypothetical protein